MTATGTLVLNAPAKINLFLHVTARRNDGYHDLSSLAVFTEFGDRLNISPVDKGDFRLKLAGPFADQISSGADNLVLQAKRKLNDESTRSGVGAHIVLEKNIPVAAGLGGGSADAAATLKGLNRFWGLGFDAHGLQEIGSGLGADVSVCIAGVPSWMRGVGDRLMPASGLPELPLLLVNPGKPISTPQVFQGLKLIPEIPDPVAPDSFADVVALADFLRACRNDLEAPAIKLVPEIAEAKALMDSQPECLLARMSGSGATIFGLFLDDISVTRAAAGIRSARPDWWVMETRVQASGP